MRHRSAFAATLGALAGLVLLAPAPWAGEAGLATGSADSAAPGAGAEPEKTPKAPINLALKDLQGVRRSLADLRGRIVLLNFWASWCGPCRKEMPDLAALRNQLGPRGVEVIGASTDDPEDEPDVRKFVRDHHVDFPVWLGATVENMEAFGLPAILPSTVLLDRDGFVAERLAGTVSPKVLREKIDALLRAPARASADSSRNPPASR